MKIGQNKVNTSFVQRIRPKDIPMGGTFVCRIVSGPINRHFHIWPTMVEDQNTKMMKPSWKLVTVDKDSRTPLDELAQVDVALKKKHLKMRNADESRARSLIKKQNRYDFAVIPRTLQVGSRNLDAGKIIILEANYSIQNDIKKISTQPHPTTPGMLFNGLQYMYDVSITKGTNDKTGYPEYSVSPIESQVQGKISVDYLDVENNPVPNPEQFFSAQDLAIIQSTDWELESIDKPVSIEELKKIMEENPLDLSRREKNNPSVFLFFNDKEDFEALNSHIQTQGLNTCVPSPNQMQAIPQSNPVPQENPYPQQQAPVQQAPPQQQAPVQQAPQQQAQQSPQQHPPVQNQGVPQSAQEVPITRPESNVSTATGQTNLVAQPKQQAPQQAPEQPEEQQTLKKPNLW